MNDIGIIKRRIFITSIFYLTAIFVVLSILLWMLVHCSVVALTSAFCAIQISTFVSLFIFLLLVKTSIYARREDRILEFHLVCIYVIALFLSSTNSMVVVSLPCTGHLWFVLLNLMIVFYLCTFFLVFYLIIIPGPWITLACLVVIVPTYC